MNPIASKLTRTLNSVKEQNASSWNSLELAAKDTLYEAALIPEAVANRYSSGLDDDEEEDVEVFPKFIPASLKKIIVDDNDGKTWEDEHSGQFSWETSSQLEMNLSDLDTATTPAVPRKSSESTGGATSPNGGVGGGAKPTPIRKARLVENWLDSPVLKAMQENSSSSQSDGSEDRASPLVQKQSSAPPPATEEPDILSKFGITFSLSAGDAATESCTDEAVVFPATIAAATTEMNDKLIKKKKKPDDAAPITRRESHKRSSTRRVESNDQRSPASDVSFPPADFSPEDAKKSPGRIVETRHDQSAVGSRDEDEEKQETRLTATNKTTTTTTLSMFATTTIDPDVECDDVEIGFSATGEETSAMTTPTTTVKTGFDFLDNW